MMVAPVGALARPDCVQGDLSMTCDHTLWYAIPEATAQAVQRAFPKGNLYMTMYDVLGPIFTNPDFADLYQHRGRPAEAPACLGARHEGD
jgi:hypothetical protein